jgi:uncharacterized protein DUF6882
MSPIRPVDCAEHGAREATFVCQHLVAGKEAGFHHGRDDDDPDALWPDAWCDACEHVRQSEGGWNDRSEAFAAVRVLCDRCYENARQRNWKQDHAAFDDLVTDAVTYLQARQDDLVAQYRIGSYPRYDWNQDTGQLVFSRDGRAQVVADIQFVGSIATDRKNWMWSWANPSLSEAVKREARRVRSYGDEHRHLKLAAACWAGEETDGWEMTAITAYLLGATGAYRSPDDRGFVFMVLTAVQWAQ